MIRVHCHRFLLLSTFTVRQVFTVRVMTTVIGPHRDSVGSSRQSGYWKTFETCHTNVGEIRLVGELAAILARLSDVLKG